MNMLKQANDKQQRATAHVLKRRVVLGQAVCTVAAVAGMLLATPAFAVADESDKATPAKPLSPIKHVVVIIPENRTFDNYFGTYPNAANLPFEESWMGVPAPK